MKKRLADNQDKKKPESERVKPFEGKIDPNSGNRKGGHKRLDADKLAGKAEEEFAGLPRDK